MLGLLAVLILLPQDPDRLIRDLAHEDPGVRDAATAELVKMGKEKARPILERAGAHQDPEVRARAGAVRRIFDPPPPPPEPQNMRSSILAAFMVAEIASREVRFLELRTSADQFLAPAAPEAPAGPAPKSETVRDWVRDLGSDSLKARERASEHLRSAGKHVEAQLKKASASRDREVALRARSLLSALRRPAWSPSNGSAIFLSNGASLKIVGEGEGRLVIIELDDAATTTIEIRPAVEKAAKPPER